MSFHFKYFTYPLFLFAVSLTLFSCKKVTIVVKDIPRNTPPGAVLFVAGNFNIWDPGDQSFMMRRNKDSTYSITLPRGRGKIEYKFTRGDWTTVEQDACGNEMNNRFLELGEEDTIYTKILSWEDLGPIDCNKVTFIVKAPLSTPADEYIYIAGNFNNWNPQDEAKMLQKTKNGLYTISLPRQAGDLEYKFTRGGWGKEEVDEIGEPIPNRQFTYGNADTVFIQIPAWKDVAPTYRPSVTFVVKTSQLTPVHDDIYIVGTFNKWYPADEKYRLKKKADHLYTITLPAKERYIEYKFTRGGWDKEEIDENGNKISNRRFIYGRADTIFIHIPGWIDIPHQ